MSNSLSFAQSAGTHLLSNISFAIENLDLQFLPYFCTDELVTVICKEEIFSFTEVIEFQFLLEI